MDERKLFKRLTHIYSFTAAIVMLAVFVSVGALIQRDNGVKNRDAFTALLTALADQLQTGESVSHSRLRALEHQNHLILRIRDGGETLLFNSVDGENKRAVFAHAEEEALADGFDPASPPLTALRRTSPVYSFTADGRDYLGAVSILPLAGGFRAITMAQVFSPVPLMKMLFLFVGYALSVLCLSFAGGRLIRRALLPAMESRQRQAEFIAAASHELRSPLAVISANAESILADADDAKKPAAVIVRESNRMSRLLSDMLLIASADAKRWQVALAPTEMDTVLLNAYETYLPVFRAKGRFLTLTLPDAALPKAAADAGRLSEVVGILLDNALSYGVTDANPTVELSAGYSGKTVTVTVADHGPGLTDEQKKSVFERFYRGDAARRDKQHFGLGLSIAFELTRLQGAKLTVLDTPGGGCTFMIALTV